MTEEIADKSASGLWIQSIAPAFLIVANFHASQSLHGVKIRIPKDPQIFLGRSSTEH